MEQKEEDEENRINIKFQLMNNTKQTNRNGKSVNGILANFKCGLPNIIKQQGNNDNSSDDDSVQFSLFKSRQRSKTQLLLIEDTENEIMYYDKSNVSKLKQQQQQKLSNFSSFHSFIDQQNKYHFYRYFLNSNRKLIGIYDPNSNKVNLLPVNYSFNMKSERIIHKNNYNDDDEMDNVNQTENLINTFGSKYAVKNLNKKQRLKSTKEAALAAMDRMNTAELISTTDTTHTNKRKRKRSDLNDSEDDDDKSNDNDKFEKNNIFEFEFSKSPYCLFEFERNKGVKKVSHIYDLNKILPKHIWDGMNKEQRDETWQSFIDESIREMTEFAKRCIPFAEKVEQKKGGKKYDSWQHKLIMYHILIQFLGSINKRPNFVDKYFWQNLKFGLLEQYANSDSHEPKKKKKKMRYSMTRRAKMRIVGIILLLALDVAFWKISFAAIKDIAEDLKIPDNVVMQVYGLLGCKEDHDTKVMQMTKRAKMKKPTSGIDGNWWNV